MNFLKRREAILEILCRKKHVTYQELVWKFGVARGTIRKDVLYLMCSYPIETVRGRYGGGKGNARIYLTP